MRVITSYLKIKATHHQADERYRKTNGIFKWYFCMALMSVCWALFKSAQYVSTNDLDLVLERGDQLITSLERLFYLGVDVQPTEINVKGYFVDTEMLVLYTGYITRDLYLISLAQIVGTS